LTSAAGAMPTLSSNASSSGSHLELCMSIA
jgi:hypothetical protein